MRYGSEAISVPLDILKKKDYEAMLSQALQAYGRVDYLILNTGKDFSPPFMEWSGLSTAQRLFTRYLTMPVYAIQLCLPHLILSSGCIMNFSCSNGNESQPCSAALQAFLDKVEEEFRSSGSRVHVLNVPVGNYDSKRSDEGMDIVARSAVRALASKVATYRIDSSYNFGFRNFLATMYPQWIFDILYCRYCRRGTAKKMQ
eukprot:CAMPEP_0185269138 /NCGR_PEP_ID=MMETSP1359-20130426/38950_1 /TAXON_ID=552665 /ORGANISM="Bigelowiella longifila, Strain CCMP242" /LENGTH=200 /DNA_ID=CAMNT_0027860169 /DNA_START=213 /DNA_END=815 /DNA_ORIENTATION=+